jgi:hypothetical protein
MKRKGTTDGNKLPYLLTETSSVGRKKHPYRKREANQTKKCNSALDVYQTTSCLFDTG